MSILQQLDADLKDAMRARDQLRLDTIRQVKAAATNEEIRREEALDDTQVEEEIFRLVRQHRESIEMFSKGDRKDLADKEQRELEILLSYLPEQLSPEQIRTLVGEAIEAVGASGPSDKGKVMGSLMPKVKERPRAESSTISSSRRWQACETASLTLHRDPGSPLPIGGFCFVY